MAADAAPYEKHIIHFGYLAHALYLQTMAARPDMVVHELSYDAPDGDVAPVLSIAHCYQIDSTRSRMPDKYFADAALLARCPNLLVVSASGVGYDSVDVEACTEAGVLVVNQGGGNRQAVAEHALGLMISVSKRITETDRHLRAGTMANRNNYLGDEIKGKTLGVVGIGHTGGTLAGICRAAFDMTILAFDPYLDARQVEEAGATAVDFDALLQRADYVSVHCPRSAETEGMFDAAAFAKMKPSAYFITTARGGIHDEAALYDALVAGRIKGAGLDVWDPEPPPKDHKLLTLDNVVATPHTAGVTFGARETLGRGGAEQVIDALDGKRPPRLINPSAWDRFVARHAALFGARAAV